jgi:hypothetical protein
MVQMGDTNFILGGTYKQFIARIVRRTETQHLLSASDINAWEGLSDEMLRPNPSNSIFKGLNSTMGCWKTGADMHYRPDPLAGDVAHIVPCGKM